MKRKPTRSSTLPDSEGRAHNAFHLSTDGNSYPIGGRRTGPRLPRPGDFKWTEIGPDMPKKKSTEPIKITWAEDEGTAFHFCYSNLGMLDELEAHLDKLPHVPYYETGFGYSPREIAQRLIDEERARIEAEYQQKQEEIKDARRKHFSKDNRTDTEAFDAVLIFFQDCNKWKPGRKKDLVGFLKGSHVVEMLTTLTHNIFTVHYGLRWDSEVQREFERDVDADTDILTFRAKYTPKKVEALCNLCNPLEYVEKLYRRCETPTTIATEFFRDFLKATGLGRGKGAPKKK
jgi:hypothetical protein